ncbi:anthranilate phosphoribosyltransferase [Isosphaeraceae bacterium EP7]
MTAPLRDCLARLGAGLNLSTEAVRDAVDSIMAGEDISPSLIAAFLTGLAVKGETADELLGVLSAVRARMASPFNPLPGDVPILDTCGTGGDLTHTFNISTASAIVVAACGVRVAKHGNRAASGSSGSSDVLSCLGLKLDPGPEILRCCLEELGIAFLFAPRFHPSLGAVAPVRRQLPFRTVFNLIGPLANPASPTHQLIGVSAARPADLMAEALTRLPIRRSAVVTGAKGLDEVSLDGPTVVRLVEGGEVSCMTWQPEDFGLPRTGTEGVRVGGPEESAGIIRSVLEGHDGPARWLVLANAAAALWVVDPSGGLTAGVKRAQEALDSGRAARLLSDWTALSQRAC